MNWYIMYVCCPHDMYDVCVCPIYVYHKSKHAYGHKRQTELVISVNNEM